MLRMHASAVAFSSRGALIRGASGSGKSSLALELMSRGAMLIADDQTELYMQGNSLWARAPDTITGLIEARGVGLLNAKARPAPIVVLIDLDAVETDRFPVDRFEDVLDARIPVLQKVESTAWPAALAQYLTAGRSAQD